MVSVWQVLCIRKPEEAIDLFMVEIMHMRHKFDVDTRLVCLSFIIVGLGPFFLMNIRFYESVLKWWFFLFYQLKYICKISDCLLVLLVRLFSTSIGGYLSMKKNWFSSCELLSNLCIKAFVSGVQIYASCFPRIFYFWWARMLFTIFFRVSWPLFFSGVVGDVRLV